MERNRQFESYDLIERLGNGGMGEVWSARHRLLERMAAVKVIRPDVLGQEEGNHALLLLRRFEREAKATSALQSPHTIQLYDFGITDDGTFYYAMELLNGLDLRSLVEQYGPLPAERVIFILDQICESLEEAHYNNLIHRDIKPANVFLCKYGLKYDFTKVLDFGLVKNTNGPGTDSSQLTANDVVPGSPAFMAPEVAKGGQKPDERVDIYALGCVAYWLLTGNLVFEADTPIQMVLAHIGTTPEPPSVRSELQIPSALERLTMACLEKDPDNRPHNIREVSDRLAACRTESVWTSARAEKWWVTHHPTVTTGEERARSISAELGLRDDPDLASDDTLEQNGELSAAREKTLLILQQNFADSNIDIQELERRTELAQYAETARQLRALTRDLPGQTQQTHGRDQPLPQTPQKQKSALTPDTETMAPLARVEQEGALVPSSSREWHGIFSAFGHQERKGSWRPRSNIRVTSVFGGALLDFREARMNPGMTEINCRVAMAGIEIIVPPDLYFEVEVNRIMGGAKISGTTKAIDLPEDGPWLLITGMTVFAGIEIKVRDIGEPRNPWRSPMAYFRAEIRRHKRRKRKLGSD